MKENLQIETDVKNQMIQYVELKYGNKYTVVDFEYAIRGMDSNRRDILKIKNDNNIEYNVFHYTDDDDFDELYDDYNNAYVDNLFLNYYSNKPEFSNYSLYLTVSLDWNGRQFNNEDISELNINDIIENYSLLSINSVIVVDCYYPLSAEQIKQLYDCYTELTSLNFNYYDIQIIRIVDEDIKLEKMLSNIRIDYENDWSTYNSVEQYISLSSKNISFEKFSSSLMEV